MDIYVVKRKDEADWDQYVSFVVAASSSSIAASFHPDGLATWDPALNRWANITGAPHQWGDTWPVRPEDLEVECIGKAPHDVREGRIYCASFKSG